MKLLRKTIRRIMLENASIEESPIATMLSTMEANSSFEETLGEPFEVGYRFEWEYYATDECVYEIKMSANYDDVIFIEEIGAKTEEPDAATKREWPNPYDYNEECEGKGFGTDMMEELISLADDCDVQLTLVPSAFNQTKGSERPDTPDLTAWYRRLGFEPSPQSNGTLVYNFQD